MSVSAFPYGVITAGGVEPEPSVFLPTTMTLTDVGAFTAEAEISMGTTGDLQTEGLANPAGAWVANADQGAGRGDAFETRLTTTTGDNPTGAAVGVWLALTSTRTWNWQTNNPEELEWTGTLEVREIANTSNNDSSSVDVFLSF